MRNRIIWLVVSCLMVAGLVLAGCAPTVTPTPTPTPTSTPTPSPTPTPSAGEMVKVKAVKVDGTVVEKSMEKPRYGGQFVYCFWSPPTGFDEAYIRPSNNYSNRLTSENILMGDWAKGPAGTGENSCLCGGFPSLKFMTGAIAESWELRGTDTLVFKIRKGVRFGLDPASEASRLVNGREVDANDVVYSLNRTLKTPGASLAANHPRGVKSLTAPDKYTVVIECQPGDAGPFVANGCSYNIIIPHEVIEKYGDMRDWKNVVGTGPFFLTDYVSQGSLTYVRNPNYWQKDPLTGMQLPYLDGVKTLIIPDASTRIAAIRTKKVDQSTGVSMEDQESLVMTTPELKWVGAIGDAVPDEVLPIALRMDNPGLPFVDKRVRHALLMAVDFDGIVKDYYSGRAVKLAFPGPPVPDFGDIYIPFEKLPAPIQELYNYDPEKAKKLLAEAGYPNGFKTEIVCETSHVDQLSIIKDYWSKIGVDLKIDVKEFSVWTSMRVGKSYKDMIIGSTSFHSPFKMTRFRPTATENYGNINDPYTEEVYLKCAANAFNEPERDRIWREWLLYCYDQAWYITFPTPYVYTFWGPWLKNYHGEYSVGYTARESWSTYVWLDLPLRKTMAGR